MEEPPQGEGWGFGDFPAAESIFTYGSYFYGGRTYTTRQQEVWMHILPNLPTAAPHPDPEVVQVGFQGPVSVTTEQGKRGRAVIEDAILRLLPEVKVTPTTPTDCCAICLEDFAAAPAPLTLRAMPSCSHAFHQHCILQWLRLKAACPVCRHQLSLSLSTEEEEEEEGQRRPRRRRRRSYDDWLSFPWSRVQSPFTREES
ncbi:hypothetical protein BDA96_04G075300 [Sorghum bicolor]|jgi:hypothetical protein|uniref:RING-type domain-containing protein n=2 Tax=Sorghum bicolor TaxID=4558 RepID=A0A921UHP5_SORBI|nr:E3 ubiquitin-protein ligase RNF181 [Sorghum bicolor]EES04659.1 hypothetical protein SORBI_3004G069600 [Sorghum bicolor]KAG0532059.1 hypothetical protein BDA96_04G075300 [Sorghum bicolor]|eukprot:XP_002451683.1 E3 ubiquitin-protein ligase RNF181 [Sorghum bicolor]